MYATQRPIIKRQDCNKLLLDLYRPVVQPPSQPPRGLFRPSIIGGGGGEGGREKKRGKAISGEEKGKGRGERRRGESNKGAFNRQNLLFPAEPPSLCLVLWGIEKR